MLYGRVSALYIYSAQVTGAKRTHTKRHSTISYKQLTRELTRNRDRSKCCTAKRSKINPNIHQVNISL